MTTDQPDTTINSELDQFIHKHFITLKKGRQADWDVLVISDLVAYYDDLKRLIAQEANEAVVAELEAVLKNCPMPALSYEDIEARIAQLTADKEQA